MALFAKTEAALEEIEHFILHNNLMGTPIEKYLAQYILVSLCAEIQQAVYACVKSHFSGQKLNSRLQTYIENSLVKILRSFEKEEIAGLLGHFGPETKSHFNKQFEGLDELLERYANIVKARHAIAHGNGSNLSFLEIKEGVSTAKFIIGAIQKTLDATVGLAP